MLSIRHKTMLEIILEHPEGITGKQLSGRLRVSGKTVRNDIAAVNSQLRERGMRVGASQKQGYYIEESQKESIQSILEEQRFPLNIREAQTPEERRFAVLDKVLGHPGIGIEKIAEHLCVSEQTIYKDIAYLEQKLKGVCGFTGLTVQNHRVCLYGTEEDIRRLVFRLICACVFDSGQLLDRNLHQMMNGIVNLHEICTFYEYARNYAQDREMKVSEQVLFLGTWMVFYVNVRREEAHFLQEGQAAGHEDELWDFLDYMNRSLFLEFEASDMEFLHKALGSVGFPASCSQETGRARKLFGQLSEAWESQYGIIFLSGMEEAFIRELACVLKRVRAGYQFCDWQPWDRQQVDRSYLDAGMMAAYIIRQHTGVYLSMTEICRLGKYLQAWTRTDREKVRIQMVYDGDMGQYYMARRWIEDRLGDEAEICGACPGYLIERECVRNRPHLIMGTQRLRILQKVPFVCMPESQNLEEEEKIRSFLDHAIKKERALSCMKGMISANRVVFLESGASFETMVRACVDVLEKEGCILPGSGFLQEVADRQRQYPCSLENGCQVLQPFSRLAASDGIAASLERSLDGTGHVVFVCAFSAGLEKGIGSRPIVHSLEKLLGVREFAGRLKRAGDGALAAALILSGIGEEDDKRKDPGIHGQGQGAKQKNPGSGQ